MADLNTCPSNEIREAVCIDTSRIYDSCADKDCLSDLDVMFTTTGQPIIDAATSVRGKDCEVIGCYMDVDEIQFNKGFYSVDITFYFKVTVDAYTSPVTCPTTVEGLAVFSKKCILYGSDGNVKIYTSEYSTECGGTSTIATTSPATANPRAKVQVIDPIVLETILTAPPTDVPNVTIPDDISSQFDGDFEGVTPTRSVEVTLGLFTIIQLERDVQMLIPAYKFCIPTKECCCDVDEPCDIFNRIEFPVDEFFPPKSNNNNGGCGCGSIELNTQ
ncbi:MAG: hypothetical protein K5917_04855 [Clostridiales bacterium]|nr:hypothetical protein [Clostridiales bacterium]